MEEPPEQKQEAQAQEPHVRKEVYREVHPAEVHVPNEAEQKLQAETHALSEAKLKSQAETHALKAED